MEKKRKKQNLLLKYLSDIFSAVLMTTWLLLDTFCLTFMEFFFFFSEVLLGENYSTISPQL